MTTKKWFGIEDLEKEFGPITIGLFVRGFREAEGASQTDYAKKLKISRAHLCDLEKGRRKVSPGRAAQIAKALGVPEDALIIISIEETLRSAKLKYKVELKKIS